MSSDYSIKQPFFLCVDIQLDMIVTATVRTIRKHLVFVASACATDRTPTKQQKTHRRREE